MKINEQYVNFLKETINTSPFPSLLSFELVDIKQGFAQFEMTMEKKHLQPWQIAHGGVIASLIDSAAFWAIWFSIPAGDGLVSVDLKLNYLRPADRGKLIAIGKEIKTGKTLGYAEAEVRDESGSLVAHGTSTLMILKGKSIELDSKIKKWV